MQPDDAHRSGPYFIILYYSMYRTLNSSDIFLMGLKGQLKGRSLEASFTVNILYATSCNCASLPPPPPPPRPPPPAPLLAPVSGQHDLPFLRSAVLNVCGIVTQTHKRKGEAREEGRELERN